jgi:phosphoglycolate phosphatase
MTLKAILFDLDGTLLDTLDDLKDSVNHMLKAYGYPLRSREFVRQAVGNGVRNLIVRSLPGGEDTSRVDECLAVFRAHYSQNMDNQTRPYPGVMDMLRALKDEGISAGVVSNKYDGAVVQLCQKHFGDLVPVAIGERPGFGRKPAPDSALEAMRVLGAGREETLYVGDSDVDVETARNAGLKCVGVSWGFRPRESLVQAGADKVIDDIGELLQAARAL